MATSKKITITPNLIDRVVAYVDPVAGQRRMQSRAQMAMAGSYIGADKTRRSMRNWFSTGKSADDDLLPDLATLREHSRDLMRNAPLAVGAINTVVTNVVGTGLMVQSRIDAEYLGMSEDEANAWQKDTEREFRLWADNRFECDATATQNFYALQDLAFRSTLINGDIVAILPSRTLPGCVYGLKLQLVEADRLATPPDLISSGTVFGGVEVDEFGAATGYHISDRHPGSNPLKGKLTYTRIPARGVKSGRINVILLAQRRRPDQRRGEPYLAPVIEPLKQLDRYTEAEIMAAVISGMFTVFIEHSAEDSPIATLPGDSEKPGSEPELELSSGAIVDLENGAKINTANPGRPNVAFDPFVMAVLRQIGVALELPFEVLIKHYTASYSAARAAMLEAWKFFKIRRMWLADNFCQPTYETFLAEAIALGRISAPGFFADPSVRKAWCGAVWLGDGPGSIDPMKEAMAIEKRVDIGLTTLASEIAAYDGGDFEKVHVQRVKEQRMRLDGGLLKVANAPPPEISRPDNLDE